MNKKESVRADFPTEQFFKLPQERQDAILTIIESNVQVNDMIARRAAREQPQTATA